MRSFIYLILFLYISVKYCSSNYILCTSRCPKLTVSFDQPLTIPNECQETNNLTNIYDSALICLIEYRIDYDAKQIYIDFKVSNDTNTFKNINQSEFLIQTVWLGFNQESKQPNITYRKYGCNTKNDCARLFYLNTIEYLLTDGKVKLDEISTKLYNSINYTRPRCRTTNKLMNNKTLIRCKNGICYAHNLNKKQYCTSDNSLTLFTEFEYYFPRLLTNEREEIEYKCNKDLCNGNQMINRIKNILIDYTNWHNNNNNVINTTNTQINQKSSSIQKAVPYYLIILSLIFILN